MEAQLSDHFNDPELLELAETYMFILEIAENTIRMNILSHLVDTFLKRILLPNHLILN